MKNKKPISEDKVNRRCFWCKYQLIRILDTDYVVEWICPHCREGILWFSEGVPASQLDDGDCILEQIRGMTAARERWYCELEESMRREND